MVGLINHFQFVKELMEYLDFLYSGKRNVSRIYEVCKAFYRVEKQDRSLMSYFMEFKRTYEELNMLLPFSPDMKVQQAQREQMAVMSFLAELPAEFEAAKSHILSRSTISSLQDTYSRILRTENPQSVQSGSALVSRRYEYEARRQQFRSSGRGVDTQGQSSGAIVCHYCHKPGHMKRDYRKLQSRNQGFRSAQVASSSDASGKSITVFADDFAKFSQYQESLRTSSTPVTAIAESGKPNTCLVSSSSKMGH